MQVRLLAGSIADVSDSEAGGLSDYLAGTGKIDPSALERALDLNEEARQGLARALVDTGAMDAEAMRSTVRARATENLLPLFSWSAGEYRFEEGEGPPEGEVIADLSVLEAILDGTRIIADSALVRNSLGGTAARLRPSPAPGAEYGSGRLSDSELSVLDLCRPPGGGDVVVEDVASASHLGREETLRCLHTLAAVGALELEPPEQGRERTDELSLGPPESSPALPALAPGAIPKQIGRYTVDGVLGRGAMGVVVSARDPEIERVVAIKVIQSAVHLDEAQLKSYEARFRQEARAAGKLLHPGIVAVFDAGRGTAGAPYLVMEHVEGETLKEKFDRRPATPDECREIAGQILDALSFAHRSGVVHRDLKPQNVIITPDGQAKVMDFGVAHVVGSELTQDDEMLGSPAYMAPEQLSNVAVDGRTDLFALGVVLYWMLTSKMPFEGDSLAALVVAILTKNPVPPKQLSVAVPSDLNDIVLRCLSKDPDERFADAMEMKRALIGAVPIRPPSTVGRPFWGAIAAAALGVALWALFSGGDGDRAGGEARGEIERSLSDGRALQTRPADDLYQGARAALDSGDLERSRGMLESLLEREPRYSGASELLLKVKGEAVRRRLPIVVRAKHDHRMGSCSGRLTLSDGRIEFYSEEHGTWRWAFDEIVQMGRKDSRHLTLKTVERDGLKLGGSKSYNFELGAPISRETWNGFRTIANR